MPINRHEKHKKRKQSMNYRVDWKKQWKPTHNRNLNAPFDGMKGKGGPGIHCVGLMVMYVYVFVHKGYV